MAYSNNDINNVDLSILQSIELLRKKGEKPDIESIFNIVIVKENRVDMTKEFLEARIRTLIEDGFIIDMVLDGRSSFHNIENNSNKNTHHFYNCEISQNTPEINKITNTNYMTNIETELIAMKSFLFEQVHLMKISINEFKKSYTTINKGFHYDYENEHPLAQLKKENEKLQEDIRTKNIIIKNLYQNQCLLQQQLDKKSVSNFKEYTNFNSISKNNDFITPKIFSKSKQRQHIQNFESDNRYSLLEDSNDNDRSENETLQNIKQKNNFPNVTRRKIPPAEKNQTKSKPKKKKSKNTIAVLGDSIIKEIKGYQLKRSLGNKNNVIVRSFTGASVQNMTNYAVPTLEENPKKVILHIGTNNLSSKDDSSKIADDIIHQAKEINKVVEEVAVSALTAHNDEYEDKRKEVNSILEKRVRETGFDYIKHENILKEQCLTSRGLHLNTRGTSVMAKNILNYLRGN